MPVVSNASKRLATLSQIKKEEREKKSAGSTYDPTGTPALFIDSLTPAVHTCRQDVRHLPPEPQGRGGPGRAGALRQHLGGQGDRGGAQDQPRAQGHRQDAGEARLVTLVNFKGSLGRRSSLVLEMSSAARRFPVARCAFFFVLPAGAWLFLGVVMETSQARLG